MSNEIAVKTDDKTMEFVPFGAQDKIKLSVAIVKNLIAVKTRSGKTCSDQDAIKFMMMCNARRLNPFEGDAFLIGYDGKDGPTFSLITAHQAFLKRAELNQEYDGMKSGIIIERDGNVMDLEGDFYMAGDKVIGGWATIFFKNRKQAMHKRIRLERFKKSFGIWMEDSAGMICKCAEADALRSSFPTMLGGLYLREEIQQPEARASKPIFSPPSVDVEARPVKEAVEAEPEPAREAFEPASPEPPEAEKPEPPKSAINPVKLVKGYLKIAGVKEEQLVKFLQGLNVIENDANTLDAIAEKYPEVMTMVVEQQSDLINKIKGTK